MKTNKAKIIMLIVMAVFVFFFSNDFGLIDVEKTSIITAVAIDVENDEYVITAQIAVPEATDTNAENLKAQISGKGKTVGEALKEIGDVSGWFPKLAFCNLIIIGNGLSKTNVICVLDYFAKTLRIQDSALVALSEKTAKELLTVSTPLDNISSFALQKIMLKNPGFDKDVATTDIKTFCSGYYSSSGSSIMPVIKIVQAESGTTSNEVTSEGSGSEESNADGINSGGDSGGRQDSKNNLFDARTTALFKNGIKVGELDSDLTFVYNAFNSPMGGSTVPIDKVSDGERTDNYLLTIFWSESDLSLDVNDNSFTVNATLKLYCKISDVNSPNSDDALSQNTPLPDAVKEKAEKILSERVKELLETERQTNCDFLKIQEKLYRYHNKMYDKYKDDYLSVMKTNVKVEVRGQR